LYRRDAPFGSTQGKEGAEKAEYEVWSEFYSNAP
jgi:hypothetical protein